MLNTNFKSSGPGRDNLVLELLNQPVNSAPLNLSNPRPTRDSGVLGPATVSDYMVFNGFSEGIRFPLHSDWVPQSPRSFEFDVLVDPNHINNIGSLINLGGTPDLNGSWNFAFVKTPQPNIRYRQFVGGLPVGMNFIPANLNLQYNQWYRIMVTIEDPLVIGYLNGVEVWRFSSDLPPATPGSLTIGCDNSLSPSSFFQGRLRNLRIGNEIFSPK